MNLQIGISNTWILLIPFILISIYIPIKRKDIAKRMSDMTGYTSKEKMFTVIASIMPYPFLIFTIWLSFSGSKLSLVSGGFFYLTGMTMFISSIKVIVQTPENEMFKSGPYRFSRNPMYVSAAMIFTGICLISGRSLLLCYLAVMFIFQHLMILAEERICKEKFGRPFIEYMRSTPRYLIYK